MVSYKAPSNCCLILLSKESLPSIIFTIKRSMQSSKAVIVITSFSSVRKLSFASTHLSMNSLNKLYTFSSAQLGFIFCLLTFNGFFYFFKLCDKLLRQPYLTREQVLHQGFF